MKLNSLKLRDKLVCQISENAGSEFIIRIEDVIDEQFFSTDLPVVTGGNIRFKPGTNLDFIYTTKDGVLFFKGKVKSVGDKDNLSMIIQKTTEGKRVQRREYFRLKLSFLCFIRTFNDLIKPGNNKKECSVDNISAGGIKLFTNSEQFKNGDLIYIELKNFSTIKGLWGKILKTYTIKKKDIRFSYSLSIEFTYITTKTQDILSKILFDKQREMVKFNLKK